MYIHSTYTRTFWDHLNVLLRDTQGLHSIQGVCKDGVQVQRHPVLLELQDGVLSPQSIPGSLHNSEYQVQKKLSVHMHHMLKYVSGFSDIWQSIKSKEQQTRPGRNFKL